MTPKHEQSFEVDRSNLVTETGRQTRTDHISPTAKPIEVSQFGLANRRNGSLSSSSSPLSNVIVSIVGSPTLKQTEPEKASSKKQKSDTSPGSNKSSKRRSSWRNLLNPSYKSRSDEFHKLFCDKIPKNERLIADYACALHREILIQGRVYVSVNYVAFYSNLFTWITKLVIRFRDISGIIKANTARFIPNAIQLLTTSGEKHVFASFVARDKSYIMMLRVWQNSLMNERITAQEIRNLVHFSYGKDLGMSDNEELGILDSPEAVSPSPGAPIDAGELSENDSPQTEEQDEFLTPDKNNNNEEVQNSLGEDVDRLSSAVPHSPTVFEEPEANIIGSQREFENNTQTYPNDLVHDYRIGEPRDKPVDMRPEGAIKRPLVSQLEELQLDSCSPVASSAVVLDTPSALDSSSLDGLRGRDFNDTQDCGPKQPTSFAPANSSAGREERLAGCAMDEQGDLSGWTSECDCREHQGQLIADLEFETNVDTLFTLIFTNSKFMRTYMLRRGMIGTTISSWKRISNESDACDRSNSAPTLARACDGAAQLGYQLMPNEQERQLNYSMNLNHVWAKQVQVEERQSFCQVKPGVYVLKSQTLNSGVPYGETFTVDLVYCLTRAGAINRSRMLVHSFVNFDKAKHNWRLAMVKPMIERQCIQGVSDFIGDLTSCIKEYIAQTGEQSPVRRTRRLRRKQQQQQQQQQQQKRRKSGLSRLELTVSETESEVRTETEVGFAGSGAATSASESERREGGRAQCPREPAEGATGAGLQSRDANKAVGQQQRRRSLVRAKSKLKEEKLKSIYRYYIQPSGAEGPDSAETSAMEEGESLNSLEDNESMVMIMSGGESAAAASEPDEWAPMGARPSCSPARSFSDLECARRSQAAAAAAGGSGSERAKRSWSWLDSLGGLLAGEGAHWRLVGLALAVLVVSLLALQLVLLLRLSRLELRLAELRCERLAPAEEPANK